MKKFIVYVREVHVQQVKIEAKDKKEAIEQVEDGAGKYLGKLEYSHTLDSDTWTIKEV